MGLGDCGLAKRPFAPVFSDLVYPPIWEHPVIDVEVLELQPDHHVFTMASGGCSVPSDLTANPAKITAVDLQSRPYRPAQVQAGGLAMSTIVHERLETLASGFPLRENCFA